VALERGFRRLTIAISVAVLGLGIALDVTLRPPQQDPPAFSETLQQAKTLFFDVEAKRVAEERLTDRQRAALDLVRKCAPPITVEMPDGKRATFPWGVKTKQIERSLVVLQNLRQKYPEYSDLTDQDLARRIIAKYPMYRDVLSPISASYAPLEALYGDLGQACPGRNEVSSATLKTLGLWPSGFTRLKAGTRASQAAIGLVALLWTMFYTVRWIVRGFGPKERSIMMIITLIACMLVSTVTAHAECAWVLWAKQALMTKPEQAPELTLEASYKRVEDCTRALDQKFPDTRRRTTSTVVTWGDRMWMCLPDTVDPRGPKGK